MSIPKPLPASKKLFKISGVNLMLTEIVYFHILLILLGCSTAPENFLTNRFFKDLNNSITNKSQLEEFKNLPIDSAVLNYNRFDGIFQKPIENLFKDSLYRSKFETGCLTNKLSLNEPQDGYVLAAMYHKSLNSKPFDITALKNHYYPLYLRKQVLNQDYNINTALENDCFVKELTVIKSRLENTIERIEYPDAYLIISASNPECNKNVEYTEVYNETLFKYLEKKPNQIVELLQLGNYGEIPLKIILENLQNPINDQIDINRVINNIKALENSSIRERILESLRIAKNKYGK